MNTSENGIRLIKNFEGCPRVNGIITAYQDVVNIWTIGWGHTGFVPCKGKNVCKGMTLTDEEGTKLLQLDLQKYETKILSFCNNKFLTQNRFDALTSFELNTGAAKSSTIFKLFNQGDMKGTADEFLRWVNAGGKQIPGLVKRRRKERELFLSDVNLIADSGHPTSSSFDVAEETIQKVQTWLKNYETNIVVDGIVGKRTRWALCKALQMELNNLGANLTVDGVIGNQTLNALRVFGLLSLNSRGNLVKVLEGFLFIKNYNPQEFTGYYNLDVLLAVKQYQKEHGLKEDGICGINTWTRIVG
jgi:lysozyme